MRITRLFIILSLFSGSLFAYNSYPYASLLQTFRQPLLPLDESIEDSASARLTVNWMNVWAYSSGNYLIDGEELQTEAAVKYRFNNITAGISIPAVRQGGGVLDTTIERFHSLVNVTQSGRDHYPGDVINVSFEPLGRLYWLIDDDPLMTWLRSFDTRLYPRTIFNAPLSMNDIQNSLVMDYITIHYPELLMADVTEVVILSDARRATGNPRFFAEKSLVESRNFGKLSGGIQLKIPSAFVPLLTTPGWDKSVYAVYSRKLDPLWSIKTGLSYTRFEFTSFNVFDMPDDQWVFRQELQYKFSKNMSLHGEYVYFTSPVLGWGKLSKPGHLVSFGISGKNDNITYRVAVIEDIVNFNNTADIGFNSSIEASL